MRCALEQTPRCAAWGDEPKRRGGKGGGNCHIKGKEFKINLISQSLLHPPPPLQEVYREHALSCYKTRNAHSQGEKKCKKRQKSLQDVGQKLKLAANVLG